MTGAARAVRPHAPGERERRPAIALLAAIMLTAGACASEQPRAEVTAVAIQVVPAGGGSAEFEVRRDGTTRGGHLSGDSVPFVHQAEGRLDSAAVDTLLALVHAMDSSAANANPPAGRSYAALTVSFATGRVWVTSWAETGQPADNAVRAVATWLFAHRIGGW